MVFSSTTFLLAFLPLVAILYYICPRKLRNGLLLVFSLLFYGWGEPKYILIMLFSTVFDYCNGLAIGHFRSKGRAGGAKAVLVISVVGNLAILGFFKYTDFAISNLNGLLGTAIPALGLLLPIGISFYTFQTMSYTIDVYRGLVPPQRNIVDFGAYVTLFPQLIAGPIVQYKTVAYDLEHRQGAGRGGVDIQQDRMGFRRNLERVGEVMAYEISKTFDYSARTIQTPINPISVMLPRQEVVIATVLRAGLPFHQGFLNYFDHAGSAFVSARRAYSRVEGQIEIRFDSVYTPDLTGKQLLLVDPMLATGKSLVITYRELLKQGSLPAHTHIASVIASRQGVEYVEKELAGEPLTLWTAALDEALTDKFYIDPGLGDAGDLAFGDKK